MSVKAKRDQGRPKTTNARSKALSVAYLRELQVFDIIEARTKLLGMPKRHPRHLRYSTLTNAAHMTIMN